MAEHIMILGAGRMCPAAIAYLMEHTNYNIILGDIDLERAQARAAGYPKTRIRCIQAEVDGPSKSALREALEQVQVVIDLVPPDCDVALSELCIQTKTHLVSASYVSDAMWAMDDRAKAAGVIILGESGLDPGLDHMAAMRVIQRVQAKGGTVLRHISYCGGIPYNMVISNPLQYKVTWSPALLLFHVANRTAQYRENGKSVTIPPRMVYEPLEEMRFEGFMTPEFVTYPNGNAERYLDLYGIPDAQTIMRKTLRYKGWNAIFHTLHQLGWFSDQPAGEVIRQSQDIPADSPAGGFINWLGLNEPAETNLTALDYIVERFANQPELMYSAGERDLVILQNVFDVQYPDAAEEPTRITSTLTVVGDEDGFSAMEKTVGYTCAAAACLLDAGHYTDTGVQMPNAPGLYNPILDAVAEFGIVFEETTEVLG